MKAMLLMGHGGPEMMKFGEAPDPKAGPGEVVVDIHAASVNGADPKVRRGNGRYKLDKFPHIMGRDFSGVVSAVGPGVTDFKVGDAVFAVTDVGIEGTYAEKIAIKAAIVAKKPEGLSHAEAAALGLVSLTALTAIEDTAHLKAGETILIQGGAGGVAGFAVQLAKHLGAKVITTASAGNHAYVRSLGADQVIDYNAEDFTKIGPVCDVVFDTVGGNVRAGSYAVLEAGRQTGVDRAGAGGLQAAARGCRDLASRRQARPRPSRAAGGAAESRRGAAARDSSLQAGRRGRSPSRQRSAPSPGQAGVGNRLIGRGAKGSLPPPLISFSSSKTRHKTPLRRPGSRW